MPRLRGAHPSPKNRIARAPWAGEWLRDVAAPPQFATLCTDYDMAGNDQYGDCVTAEEVNSKKAWSVSYGINEIEIAGATAVAWARKHGFLNGATLIDVLEVMQSAPLTDKNGIARKNGTPHTVDYGNQQEMMAAIYTYKTVKIAVAADQLEGAVTDKSGWFLINAKNDRNTDHCVGLHGHGPASYLAGLLNVPIPSGFDPSTFCVLLYTWATVGIVSWQSLMGLMADGEAWIRDPGDTVQPVPPPLPPPDPPGPIPGPRTMTITIPKTMIQGGGSAVRGAYFPATNIVVPLPDDYYV